MRVRGSGEGRGLTRVAIERLTHRELEVLRGLLRGEQYKQIAHELGISEMTVKKHANSLFRQYDVSGRSELQAAFVIASVIDDIDARVSKRSV